MFLILKDIYIFKERHEKSMPLPFGAKNNNLIIEHKELYV